MFGFVALCGVAYVWHFALSLSSEVPSSHGGSSAARLVWPLRLGVQSKRQYTFGPPVEARDDGGWAEGQETSHASSSHWESWLLQGHLYRRPERLLESRAWSGT